MTVDKEATSEREYRVVFHRLMQRGEESWTASEIRWQLDGDECVIESVDGMSVPDWLSTQ